MPRGSIPTPNRIEPGMESLQGVDVEKEIQDTTRVGQCIGIESGNHDHLVRAVILGEGELDIP
jgi:hypothetical protein